MGLVSRSITVFYLVCDFLYELVHGIYVVRHSVDFLVTAVLFY